MDEVKSTEIEQRLNQLHGRLMAHHTLLVVLIGAAVLPSLPDPKDWIANLRVELTAIVKNIVSELPADDTAARVKAMETELELMLAGLSNRAEAELQIRQGKTPDLKPSVIFGSTSNKKPN